MGEYDCKIEVIGNNPGMGKSARFLNRVITYTTTGIEFEADQRLVEAMVDDLDLQGSKPADTPGSKPKPIAKVEHQKLMERRLGELGECNTTIANLRSEIGVLRKALERLGKWRQEKEECAQALQHNLGTTFKKDFFHDDPFFGIDMKEVLLQVSN